MAAQYKLLTDHYFPNKGIVLAGTYVTEGDGNIPIGWTPTLAVEPLNSDAITAFWNTGPRGMNDAECGRDYWPLGWLNRFENGDPTIPIRAPSVYWAPVAGRPGVWQLTGNGASLGPRT